MAETGAEQGEAELRVVVAWSPSSQKTATNGCDPEFWLQNTNHFIL